MNLEDLEHDNRDSQSIKIIITWIVAMNLIFSFDSISKRHGIERCILGHGIGHHNKRCANDLACRSGI